MADKISVVEKAVTWFREKSKCVTANQILAFAAIAALYTQFAAFKSSQDQFVKGLLLDHKQKLNENALALWDSWEDAFINTTRSDTAALRKWLKGYPEEGEDVSDAKRQEYKDWLEYFLVGSGMTTDKFQRISETLPDHIAEIFLPDDDDKKITLGDADRIRKSVVRALNVMEKVAVAYKYEIANREILCYAFEGSIALYVDELKIFIEAYADQRGNGNAWQPLRDLVTASDGDWNRSRWGPIASQANRPAPALAAFETSPQQGPRSGAEQRCRSLM